MSIGDFIAKYKSRQFVLYTTPSHTTECPRLRAIFPLAARRGQEEAQNRRFGTGMGHGQGNERRGIVRISFIPS